MDKLLEFGTITTQHWLFKPAVNTPIDVVQVSPTNHNDLILLEKNSGIFPYAKFNLIYQDKKVLIKLFTKTCSLQVVGPVGKTNVLGAIKRFHECMDWEFPNKYQLDSQLTHFMIDRPFFGQQIGKWKIRSFKTKTLFTTAEFTEDNINSLINALKF